MTFPAHDTTTRRTLLVTTAASTGGIVAAACGSALSTGAGGDTSGAPPAGVRAGTTVTFFQGGTPVDVDVRKAIFTAFQDKNPQIKVQHVFNANDNAAKVQAGITAGTPPDIFYVGNGADVT